LEQDADIEARFYGGVEGTIGGNTVVITAKKAKRTFSYFFDCGINLQKYSRFRLLGGKLETLEQLQRWGFFPEFEGIGEVRACFISHGHNDHWLALPAFYKSTIAPQTLWTTKTTKYVMKGLNVPIRDKPLDTLPFEHNSFYFDNEALKDNIRINIAPFPVDHSIPGACAYLLETRNGVLVYTGDFRDHGLLSLNIAQQFWDYVKSRSQGKKLELICEGTNYGTPLRFTTESTVRNRFREILKNYENELLSVILTEKDLWRNIILQQAVEDLKIKDHIERQLVYCESTGKLMRGLCESFRADYRSVFAEPILENFNRLLRINQDQIFTTELLTKIVQNPSKYILVATRREGFNACDLIANKMKYRAIGGCCVLSLSETFEEEIGVSTRDYAKSIAELGFSVEELHSSGHIFPHRLLNVLRQLNPNRVFIVHTSVPEGLKNYIKARTGIDVVAPKLDAAYSLFDL
jgi:hypothetical protein